MKDGGQVIITITIAIAIAALMPARASAGEFASSRVTITTEGSGKDVILIPGHSSSPRVWTEMIAAVPGYRYHLVQVKGFAGTPRDGNGEGDVVAPVADEISRYIEETELGSVIVVGHSMGGTIGIMLAARRPKQVSKLVGVDMVPFLGLIFGGPDATPASVKPLAKQIRAAIAGAPADVGEKRLRAFIAGMIRTESMRPLAVEDAVTTDPDVAGRAYEELIVTDFASRACEHHGQVAHPLRDDWCPIFRPADREQFQFVLCCIERCLVQGSTEVGALYHVGQPTMVPSRGAFLSCRLKIVRSLPLSRSMDCLGGLVRRVPAIA